MVSLIDVPLRDEDGASVRPASRPLEFGRDFREGRCPQAAVSQPGLAGLDELVGCIRIKRSAPKADQEVVAQGDVRVDRGAPLGIAETIVRPDVVGVSGPVSGGERALVLGEVVDEARAQAHELERLRGELGLEIVVLVALGEVSLFRTARKSRAGAVPG